MRKINYNFAEIAKNINKELHEVQGINKRYLRSDILLFFSKQGLKSPENFIGLLCERGIIVKEKGIGSSYSYFFPERIDQNKFSFIMANYYDHHRKYKKELYHKQSKVSKISIPTQEILKYSVEYLTKLSYEITQNVETIEVDTNKIEDFCLDILKNTGYYKIRKQIFVDIC